MIYEHCTIVITLAISTALRNLAQKLDRNETDGMFKTGLSATGVAPASHFVSSGQIPTSFVAASKSASLMHATAQAAFAAEGVAYPYTLTQVTAALAACSISNGTFNNAPENPHQFIARLGLQIVRTTI